jgi:uncharacterized UPF0146 family protein
MSSGELKGVGTVYSVICPPVVMRPMMFVANSVNQRLPSGPALMPHG